MTKVLNVRQAVCSDGSEPKGQFWIEGSAPGDDHYDRYVSFSGYYGSYGPEMFAAAPEMADMLKCFVDWLDAFGDEPDCDEIRALLAKIEGQNNG